MFHRSVYVPYNKNILTVSSHLSRSLQAANPLHLILDSCFAARSLPLGVSRPASRSPGRYPARLRPSFRPGVRRSQARLRQMAHQPREGHP